MTAGLMRSPLPSKADLMAWADDRAELDLVSKTILWRLAWHAQEDGDTWAKVETLAGYCNCSVRTVQYRMRDLIERGYLADSGRTHRLKGSTRTVPLYLLKPTIEAVEVVESMGANSAPIDGAWVQETSGMGATVCTPNETLETQDLQKGASARADEDLKGAYRRLEEAYPPEALGYTDAVMAARALADLIGQGVSVDDLVAAAADFAESPRLKTRSFGPVGLQRWLGEGRYRGFGPFLARARALRAAAPVAGTAAAEAAGAVAWAGPDGLRAQVVKALGAVGGGCLDRARWDGEARRVTAATTWAFGKLREAAGIFEQHGCELVAPNGGEA